MPIRSLSFFGGVLFAVMLGTLMAEPIPPTQLLLSIAPNTESSVGILQRFERLDAVHPWQPVGTLIPVQYGKNGLAWGRGLHAPQEGLQKKEGDGRAPMGRFLIGTIFGDAPQLPTGAKWTDYVEKTDRVAWIDDPALPQYYNHPFILAPGATPPPWFEKERMKLNDPAHEWEILIEHNYTDAVPGAGSAIFFHIERAQHHPSFGCTVMTRENLKQVVLWLDPQAHPQLVQLDQADYERLRGEWNLPTLPAP